MGVVGYNWLRAQLGGGAFLLIEVHCLLKIEQLCVKIQGRVGGNVYTIVDVDLCCKTCAVTVSFLRKFISRSVRIAKLCCQRIFLLKSAFNGEYNIKAQFCKRKHGLVCSFSFCVQQARSSTPEAF